MSPGSSAKSGDWLDVWVRPDGRVEVANRFERPWHPVGDERWEMVLETDWLVVHRWVSNIPPTVQLVLSVKR